ncbi:DUF551 domain-containing protein [Klebsiella aerogenes]|uniref:DUF551 domain-containing protein n=1 Tax=Klebsiella aerogenes TaxID=548 RepID=UPI003F499950
MTKSTITRERIQRIIRTIDSEAYDEEEIREWLSSDEIMELARIALAAMDSESGCLPLDYLQGHKDGLEWAAQLAEANHPETGDWLYDDPIELAKAIRKGPDMPPAQPAPVVPEKAIVGEMPFLGTSEGVYVRGWNDCRAAMLQAEPVTTANKLGKSPVIPDCYVMVPKEVTLEIGNAINVVGNRCTCGNCSQRLWDLLLAAAQHDTPALNPVQSVLSVQGWIPVSERLPEEGGRYWCYVEEQNSLGKSHYQWNCSWNGEIWGGAMMYGRVTHWMPLPNPPREEK